MPEINSNDDLIDVRDVIEQFEELETDSDVGVDDDLKGEFKLLQELLDDLKGNGGDEEWRGDWYPITLIRDTYFETYAEEFADDIGAINSGATWPNNCIDWERAARELQADYTSCEFDGITYWYR